MHTTTRIHDPNRARAYFEDKLAFTTGPVELDRWIKANENNLVVVDVREAEDYEKGHIPGATNIDINSTQFTEKVSGLDKGKTYLVNCAVGMRSARACQKMAALGFTNLVDLAPGFEGWKKAGKPVTK